MELYDRIAGMHSASLTKAYSTSFSLSILLFPKSLRPHIYAIYGLVRIADEIVDTYQGKDAGKLLDQLEHDVMESLRRGYSPNTIVHAFVQTARRYSIDEDEIVTFFESMRMDLKPVTYTDALYRQYIYGSAEVVGLMCLKVFCDDRKLFKQLKQPAQSLGSAYQQVNFLRDIAADAADRQRWYFPEKSLDTFDDVYKMQLVADIQRDMDEGKQAIALLPKAVRKAMTLSILYYNGLLRKIDATPAVTLQTTRIRISTPRKLALLLYASLGGRV